LPSTDSRRAGVFDQGRLEILDYGKLEPETIEVFASPIGHGGGDEGLLDHFTDVASRDALDEVLASGRSALESHRLGFAAERARLEETIIRLGPLIV
jgi:hypothetical protein